MNAMLDLMAELVGTKRSSQRRLRGLWDFEQAAGRQPRDARYQGAPGDIDSPPRVIEVKAFGKSSPRF